MPVRPRRVPPRMLISISNVPARTRFRLVAQLVMTDIQVHAPEGCYGRVAPRSGLAVNNFIVDVGAGVVDEDYRGNLGMAPFNDMDPWFNHSDTEFKMERSDRIVQFICERIKYPEVEEVSCLTGTKYRVGGFGSGTNWSSENQAHKNKQ